MRERSYETMRNIMLLSELNTRQILSNQEIRRLKPDAYSIDFLRMDAADLAPVLSLSWKQMEKIDALYADPLFKSKLEVRLERALRQGVGCILNGDAAYPTNLETIETAPAILWVLGPDPAATLNKQMVTIVGTRRASPYGKRAAHDISRYLALRDVCVVSGMALGIDGEAHHGALGANGDTIAVLASGVDELYPPQHRSLYHSIIERGLILSEHPPGMRAAAFRFPARNRLLAALSKLTVVVESSMRSGTLITVDYALQYDREVMVVPGNIYSPESKGCNRLIYTGASILTDMTDMDIYLEQPEKRTPAEGQVTEDTGPVLRLLSSDSLSLEELMNELAYTPDQLASELAIYESKGLITQNRGRYALTSRVQSSI